MSVAQSQGSLRHPKILLAGPIAVAWDNPMRMQYGGVERVGWRLAHLLTAAGFDTIPIAPMDSRFGLQVSRRALWPGQSLCRSNRVPRIFAEDQAKMIDDYCRHLSSIIDVEKPDVTVLLGPSAEILQSLVDRHRQMLASTIVALHNGPRDNVASIPILRSSRAIRLLALSESQRLAFADLSSRIEVVLDGIPVESIQFSSDPSRTRMNIMRDPVYRSAGLRPGRPLISQVDYFHPNKGMLVSLEIFKRSGLSETHDLVLAGGMGWQLSVKDSSVARVHDANYLDEMLRFVRVNNLQSQVHILDALTGEQVTRLLRATDIVLSPVRMDHGPLWLGATSEQDPESYGQSRAYANAAGTPVLMSSKYDSSFVASLGGQRVQFDTFESGCDLLRRVTRSALDESYRLQVRRFAEERDDFRPGFKRYVGLIRELLNRSQSVQFKVSDLALSRAADALVGLESSVLEGDD